MGCGKNKYEEKIRKLNNNKGFSMVELIVVIAIMAVLTGLIALGVNVMRAGDTKKANVTIAEMLQKTRTNAMAIVGLWQLEIYNDNGRCYVASYKQKPKDNPTDPDKPFELVEKKEIGSRVNVYYMENKTIKDLITTTSGVSKLAPGDKLIVTFAATTGMVSNVERMSSLSSEELNKADTNTSASTGATTGVRGVVKQAHDVSIAVMFNKKNQDLTSSGAVKYDTGFTLYFETGKVVR